MKHINSKLSYYKNYNVSHSIIDSYPLYLNIQPKLKLGGTSKGVYVFGLEHSDIL